MRSISAVALGLSQLAFSRQIRLTQQSMVHFKTDDQIDAEQPNVQ
jgi:hypothetical protein